MKIDMKPNKPWRTNRHKLYNSFQHPFNRAGGRTSNVRPKMKRRNELLADSFGSTSDGVELRYSWKIVSSVYRTEPKYPD
jgi:hypothetical protein